MKPWSGAYYCNFLTVTLRYLHFVFAAHIINAVTALYVVAAYFSGQSMSKHDCLRFMESVHTGQKRTSTVGHFRPH